ncbi:MAG: hypothetical protein P4L84_36045 [Isosphaeraceae bacterium]|nr:hypothetical protein [Isosphaeraceae bacterium]
MDLTRLYQPPSNATLLAATSPLFELSTRVAAIAQLRERKGLTREQRQLFEMSLAEIVEDVRRAGLVKARGLAYVVNDSGQLVSALPLT